jgi:hypothetical protein
LRIAPKSTFIIMGVIISQMSIAMGTLIWLPPGKLHSTEALYGRRQKLPQSQSYGQQSATYKER